MYTHVHPPISGTWWSRLLVWESLTSPGVEGWSGTQLRKWSKLLLNISMSPWLELRRTIGRRLNNWQPLTLRLHSFAAFTLAGVAWAGSWAGTAHLPVLELTEKGILYPDTRPWEIFQIKIIWYLSLLRSWLYSLSSCSFSQYVSPNRFLCRSLLTLNQVNCLRMVAN